MLRDVTVSDCLNRKGVFAGSYLRRFLNSISPFEFQIEIVIMTREFRVMISCVAESYAVTPMDRKT